MRASVSSHKGLCALVAVAALSSIAHADELARPEHGVRLIGRTSVPANCTLGRLCLWYDSSATALKFRKADGTDLNLSAGGGGAGTFQQTYDASSNPVRITQDNTRDGLILRANGDGNSPLVIETSGGSNVAHFDADGSLEVPALYSTLTVSNSLLIESATANSGTNVGVKLHNATALTGSTKIVTFGSNSVEKSSIFNDGSFLGPGATLTRDALATTTATALKLQNTTPSTGVTEQVSPALALEGTMWSGTSQVIGAKFHAFRDPADYTSLAIALQFNGGGYNNIGRITYGFGGTGISFGDYNKTNFLDFGGGASGANAIRVVAAGASHTVFDSTGIHPYTLGSLSVGNTTDYFGESAIRHPGGGGSAPTCAAGAALGSGGSPGCTVDGTDAAFEVTFTTGAAGTSTGLLGTITFSSAWDSKPFCTAFQSNQFSAGTLWDSFVDRATSTTTTLEMKSISAPGAGGASYKFVVHCVQ